MRRGTKLPKVWGEDIYAQIVMKPKSEDDAAELVDLAIGAGAFRLLYNPNSSPMESADGLLVRGHAGTIWHLESSRTVATFVDGRGRTLHPELAEQLFEAIRAGVRYARDGSHHAAAARLGAAGGSRRNVFPHEVQTGPGRLR